MLSKLMDEFKINLQLFADDSADIDNSTNDADLDTGDATGDQEGLEAGDVDPQRTSKQPPELDAAFARARRAEEELSKRDAWVKEQFGTHGIETWEQYQSAISAQLQQQQQDYIKQKEAELEEMGLNADTIREIMKNDPEFMEMKQQNQFLKQQIEEQQKSQRLVAEFQELTKEYPDIVSKVDDIDETTWQRYDKGGVTLVEAFELSNKKTLTQKKQEAAKQQALNSVRNRSHLKTEGDGAEDGADVNIPPETLQMYLDQGMSKAQAAKYHKKLYS